MNIGSNFGPPWVYPEMAVLGRFLKNRHGFVFTACRTHESQSFGGLYGGRTRREVCTVRALCVEISVFVRTPPSEQVTQKNQKGVLWLVRALGVEHASKLDVRAPLCRFLRAVSNFGFENKQKLFIKCSIHKRSLLNIKCEKAGNGVFNAE